MKMHVISNTHWDREHRHSFPVTQFMLTDLMDELIEIMENDENYKYFTLDGQSIMDCSQNTAAEADHEVRAILNQCYEDAKEILTQKRELLDEIALYLLQKETITGDELMSYVNADANRLPPAQEEV